MPDRLAVVCLTRGYPRQQGYRDLIRRNRSIAQVVFPVFPNAMYVLCHEGNIPEDHQVWIASQAAGVPWEFRAVAFPRDRETDHDPRYAAYRLDHPHPSLDGFPMGYRHMCRFWFMGVMEVFPDVDRILRIDEDCEVLSIDAAHAREASCGITVPWMQPRMDAGFVTRHLGAFIRAFLTERADRGSIGAAAKERLRGFHRLACPYTNVMLMDLKRLRVDAGLRAFQEAVDASGCIFTNRWGDLPLWAVYKWFVCADADAEVIARPFMRYRHGSHNNRSVG